MVGNIGIPIFDEIEKFDNDTIVVVELSCHQLKFTKASPNISVLLNIYQEHLDLYKSYMDYQEAKINIFKYQKNNDYKIIGASSPDSYKWSKNYPDAYTFSCEDGKVKNGIIIKEDGLFLKENNAEKLIYLKNRKRNLLGDHNLYNIAAALMVCHILNLNLDMVSNLIDDFKPLEHRMELVGTFKDITFYNDSIATIPSATINCIKSVPNCKTVILGGLDRKIDLSTLVNFINSDNNSLETCIFLKETGYMLADELKSIGCKKKLIKVQDMKEAVLMAYKYTPKNSTCVLSPAAASYNTYKNFEERGKDFKNLVIKYGA